MLAQTGEHGGGINTGVVSLYRNILQKEGIVGLWAGNGANLLRVFPAKAVVFSSNDVYQQALRHVFFSNASEEEEEEEKKFGGILSFVAGGLSGVSATALTYPLDLARGRIAGKLASSKQYSGILSTLSLTVREEGIAALYKGATPTLLGAMPYEGIKFGTVGLLEQAFSKQENTTTTTPPWLRKLLFGGMGGIMAGIITYPNDTVRRLLQLQGSRGTNAHFTGYWQVKHTTRSICRFSCSSHTGVSAGTVSEKPMPSTALPGSTEDSA